MFRGFDYESMDGIFLFIGAISDIMCDNEKNAEATKLFTIYVELLGGLGKVMEHQDGQQKSLNICLKNC